MTENQKNKFIYIYTGLKSIKHTKETNLMVMISLNLLFIFSSVRFAMHITMITQYYKVNFSLRIH